MHFPKSCSRARPTRSEPTGMDLGVNFAVFSTNAHRIEVCLFDSTGRKELMRFDLPECTDEIWHGYLPRTSRHRLRLSRPRPLSAAAGPPLQPAQAPARPLRAGKSSASSAGPTRSSATACSRSAPTCLSTAATAPPSCRNASSSTTRSTGPTTGRSTRRGATRVIYEAHVRGLTMPQPDVASTNAAPSPALADPGVYRPFACSSASPRSSCCRSTRS